MPQKRDTTTFWIEGNPEKTFKTVEAAVSANPNVPVGTKIINTKGNMACAFVAIGDKQGWVGYGVTKAEFWDAMHDGQLRGLTAAEKAGMKMVDYAHWRYTNKYFWFSDLLRDLACKCRTSMSRVEKWTRGTMVPSPEDRAIIEKHTEGEVPASAWDEPSDPE